ncbi:delta-like protein 4 [Ptychodera flava]|uniref:delta-like protein 4 n=1 Tax=Ptychodera flava TaxID=63121 RepID=UPI003969FC43
MDVHSSCVYLIGLLVGMFLTIVSGNAECAFNSTHSFDNCGHGCLNGGTCQVIPDLPPEDNSCICPDGFTGQYCDVEVIRCSDDVSCYNGGTCVIETDPSDNDCTCPDGYTGRLCETDYRCSDSNPCLNGGTCNNQDCTCPDGVSGYLCDTVFAECGCHPDIECPSDTSCPCCMTGETCEAEEEPTEQGQTDQGQTDQGTTDQGQTEQGTTESGSSNDSGAACRLCVTIPGTALMIMLAICNN